MACFHPLTAYRTLQGQIRFDEKKGGDPLEVPCGQCIGCRLERSRQWAMRITHEASQHSENCFITLTYDAENIPPDGGLIKKHFQQFIKRLRYVYPKVRYYHCGEYGDRNNRPHYHAILFGVNFPDWQYLFDSPSGEAIYTSSSLEKIWKKGFVTIGTVSFQSAGYVARYCMKKLNGALKDQVNPDTGLKPYERVNGFTGEIIQVLPEYATMSTRPSIGTNWITRYTTDVYPKDYTTINGVRCKPPRSYDRYLESIDLDMYDDIKAGRQLQGYNSDDNSSSRLLARETVKRAQFNQLKRSL